MINPIEEIKNRLDVIEVIGSYIKLQKAGINYRAVCPFHSEKKPSFFVSPTRQIWHCFGGCGTGGDMFKFVMMIEGVEFGDALRILAQKAGVELKRVAPEIAALRTERERLYEVCELAAKFFEKQLSASKSGELARKYLLERGIKEESLKKWRVGYAPDVWQSLFEFLSSHNYKKEEIEKAGLALSSQKGSFYDRFRGRIIFPVFDLNSQVVGFGGRVFKDKDNKEVAKYVNSPQTILYDKSRTLYGLDKGKLAIRKQNVCILVEGYLDVIMAHQAETENVAATSGTALTLSQLKILKRYSENILTAFDMDLAGDSATKRGIDLAQAEGFNVKVITLPQGMDPADAVLKDPEIWKKGIETAREIMDFYFETTLSKFSKEDPEQKKAIAKILLPIIKRIPNRIVQSHWVSELAKRIGTREEVIEEELTKTKAEGLSETIEDKPKQVAPKTRKDLLEERLVSLLFRFPEHKGLIEEEIFSAFSFQIKEIYDLMEDSQSPDPNAVRFEIADFFNQLALSGEIEEIEEKDVVLEIRFCLEELRQIDIRRQLNEISQSIKMAEGEKNSLKIDELTKKFNQISSACFNER